MKVDDSVFTRLSLAQVYELFDRHVPMVTRSPQVVNESKLRARAVSWWPAHELGHLAVAKPSEVFEPMFGLGDAYEVPHDVSDHYARCKELAAMRVSAQLLKLTGPSGATLIENEREQTDETTMVWSTFGLVTRILRAHSAERIPSTFKALDGYFAAKVEAALVWKERKRGRPPIGASLRAWHS